MTSKRLFAALVVVVALTVAAATSAAGPATIALIPVTTSSTATDKAPKGPSRGDRYVTTSRLVNAGPQFGKKKGTVVGGTGSFAGARGTLTINGSEKRAWNVYHLTYG